MVLNPELHAEELIRYTEEIIKSNLTNKQKDKIIYVHEDRCYCSQEALKNGNNKWKHYKVKYK